MKFVGAPESMYISNSTPPTNNSFIKKMARKVTGLIGWSSESEAAVIQNRDSLSRSGDEDIIAPNAKRLRVDTADTSCIPSTSRGINNVYSPIQPVNDLQAYSENYRNKYLMSSTSVVQSSSDKIFLCGNKSDAGIPFTSTSTQPSEYQFHGSSITDSFDINESVNSSLTIPQLGIDRRHNVTVPALSKDVPFQMSHQDSKLSGSFSYTNSRAPSFNVDVFSNAGRRLSASVCENRNSSSLSPFYSARTMYGGASSLLPYGKQNVGRMRSSHTSELNLFSPRRSQITIQPVPSTKISDQETMSAAARKILDTLEKYCSPVMDAKKIPNNESTKYIDSDTGLQSLSKGVKRKLRSLSQITPNTTDLLRIKRKEQMQDSVSNACQVVSNLPESSIVAGDNESSDSVDLDYSIFDDSLKHGNSHKYTSKIRTKKDNKIEDSPVSGVKLPNAVLKMTNLPKFDITDMFTFSKPVLVENLEQSVTEIISADKDSCKNSEIKSQIISKPAISMSEPPKTEKPILKEDPPKPVLSLLAKSSVALENNNNYKLVSSPKPAPTFMSSSLTFTKNSNNVKKASWTCKVCLLESTEESCSSCTSTREQIKTLVQLPNQPEKTSALPSTIQTLPISDWGDKFKPPSNTWGCKECFVRNSNNLTKCASCDTPIVKANDLACEEFLKMNTKIQDTDGTLKAMVQPPSGTNDLWKNLQKSVTGSWTCDSCWVQNKPSEAKCVTCGVAKEPTKSSSVDLVESPKPEFMFGMDKFDCPSPSAMLSIEKSLLRSGGTATTSGTVFTTKPMFTFCVSSTPSTPTISAVGSSNDTTSSTSASSKTFSFGSAVAPVQFSFSNTKLTSPANTPSSYPLVDGFQGDKPVENKKDAPIFNDISSSSSNTKNPLLQNNPETSSSNNTNIFKTPKLSVTKNVFANKDNGENVNAGNTYNNISSTTSDSSPLKNKNSLLPAFGSVTAAGIAIATPSNIFCSNRFGKPDNATATVSNMTVVSSSVGNVFNSTFSPVATPASITSKVNDAQISIFTSKTDTEEVKVYNKDPTIFSSATDRLVVLSSQQPNNSSVFGALTNDTDGFGSKKLDTQSETSFNAASTFSFGLTSGASSTQASKQPIGFSFNGPKATEYSTSKFVFGGSSNTFGNTAAAAAVDVITTPTPFTFNTPPATDGEQSRVNSLFSANASKTFPEQQMNTNCVSIFGSSVFGVGAQQPQPIAKKSGGFHFAPSGQLTSLQQQPVNSFNSFTNLTNENQDQNRLIANAAPTFAPFVFGGANSQNSQAHNFNLTVPPTFNFSSGNALTSFTAQPLTNSNQTSAVATRKIRKAVRRTAK